MIESIILKWTLVALLALGAVSEIAMIGEPRKPITRGSAILGVIINVLLIIWIL